MKAYRENIELQISALESQIKDKKLQIQRLEKDSQYKVSIDPAADAARTARVKDLQTQKHELAVFEMSLSELNETLKTIATASTSTELSYRDTLAISGENLSRPTKEKGVLEIASEEAPEEKPGWFQRIQRLINRFLKRNPETETTNIMSSSTDVDDSFFPEIDESAGEEGSQFLEPQSPPDTHASVRENRGLEIASEEEPEPGFLQRLINKVFKKRDTHPAPLLIESNPSAAQPSLSWFERFRNKFLKSGTEGTTTIMNTSSRSTNSMASVTSLLGDAEGQAQHHPQAVPEEPQDIPMQQPAREQQPAPNLQPQQQPGPQQLQIAENPAAQNANKHWYDVFGLANFFTNPTKVITTERYLLTSVPNQFVQLDIHKDGSYTCRIEREALVANRVQAITEVVKEQIESGDYDNAASFSGSTENVKIGLKALFTVRPNYDTANISIKGKTQDQINGLIAEARAALDNPAVKTIYDNAVQNVEQVARNAAGREVAP